MKEPDSGEAAGTSTFFDVVQPEPADMTMAAHIHPIHKLFLLPYYVDDCLFFSLMIKSSV